ncbi:MAG: alpha/beta hydrolase, partial [Verrucomicrobia bacterium]|nr:alpha/beta hydrolase [Verrucomicrobiota bacterium]
MKKYAPSRKVGDALTIQLLGSRDDVIAPDDDVDLISGRDFIYLDVPNTGHTDIIFVDKALTGQQDRSQILCEAFTADVDRLWNLAVKMSDQPLAKVDTKVTDVIFVVHGIRDVGCWTKKVARRVIARARRMKDIPEMNIVVTNRFVHGMRDPDQSDPDDPNRRIFSMETASYGYFPMAPFLFASRRRQEVEWLMNQYADAMATYPNATFSCVAHSNGTYLVAKALELYPACRFKRIVFAGSVVRRNFDWQRYIA